MANGPLRREAIFLEGARGRVTSLLQREAKFPLAGRNFMEGPGGTFRNGSP